MKRNFFLIRFYTTNERSEWATFYPRHGTKRMAEREESIWSEGMCCLCSLWIHRNSLSLRAGVRLVSLLNGRREHTNTDDSQSFHGLVWVLWIYYRNWSNPFVVDSLRLDHMARLITDTNHALDSSIYYSYYFVGTFRLWAMHLERKWTRFSFDVRLNGMNQEARPKWAEKKWERKTKIEIRAEWTVEAMFRTKTFTYRLLSFYFQSDHVRMLFFFLLHFPR